LKLLRLLLAGPAALLFACGQGDGESSTYVETDFGLAASEAAPQGGGGFTRLVESLSPRALDRVQHAGERIVEVFEHAPDAGGVKRLAYRERIVTDGDGHYSIRLVDTLTEVGPDPVTFEIQMVQRQGWHYRYRDFALRDEELFRRNYRLTDLASEVVIAGRDCDQYEARRRDGKTSFLLGVDRETGLLLAYTERDEEGRVLASMRYSTFEAAPDLQRVAFHRSVNDERSLERGEDLALQLGVETLVPRRAPEDYRLWEAATVSESSGKRWLKLSYTDGVKPLFFLTPAPFDDEGQSELRASPDDQVSVHAIGRANVVQGSVWGREVVAVGEVEEGVLLDLIESALP